MKYYILLLSFTMFFNTVKASVVDANYYHCKNKRISIAFFHLFESAHAGEGILDVEVGGHKLSVKQTQVEDQKEFITIKAVVGSVRPQKISFRLTKPNEIPGKSQRMVIDYGHKFRTDLYRKGLRQHKPRPLSCEVFGLNHDFFGELPRFIP